MRLLYYFLSLFVSVGLCAEAQTVKKTPAYLMPGAELGGSQISVNANVFDNVAKKANNPASKLKTAKRLRVAGTALDASSKDTRTIDTVLVTSFDNIEYINGEAIKRNINTIEYDKYGYRTLLKSENRLTHYTYNCDEQGRWLSRTVVEQRDDDDESRFISKEERTLEDGRVKSITKYAFDYDSNQPYKEHYYEFAYLPGSMDYSNGSEYLADVALTKEIVFDAAGNILFEERYTWFEGANDYYLTYQKNDYSRLESVISDNMFVASHYQKLGEDSEYLQKSETWIFGKIHGKQATYYSESGDVYYTETNFTENYLETTGDSVSINYDYVDDNFIPTTKEVYSPGWKNYTVDYTKDFTRSLKIYNYEDGQWVFSRESSLSNRILPNGLCELTQIEGPYKTTVINKIVRDKDNEFSWLFYPAKVNEDNSFTIFIEESGYYLYEYYSAEGELLRTIKQVESDMLSDASSFFVKAAGESEWKPLDEYTQTESEGGANFRIVYKTNANGLPESITEYLTSSRYNDGVEFKSAETLFTYGTNDDYTIEIYEVLSPSNISVLYLSEKKERKTLSDGSIETTNWYYYENGNGKVEDADRTVLKNNVITYYNYKRKDDSWSRSSAMCIDDNYVTDDGVTVSISRRLSDDETYAINTTKYESARSETDNVRYEMNASYTWDETNNCWHGDYKSEEKNYSFIFPINNAHYISPLSTYNDEYLVVVKYDYDSFYGDRQESTRTEYEWDEDKNDWKITESTDFEYQINGNQLKTITKKTSSDSWESKIKTTTRVIECDSDNRMTLDETTEDEMTYPVDEEPRRDYLHYKTVYTYNESNGLLEDERKTDYNVNGDVDNDFAYHYTYGKFSIIASGIDEIATDNGCIISIDGDSAVAEGQWITIYNINGALVSSGFSKADMPKTKGIYLIKAGTAVRKAITK